jgi:hypothetical protein
MKENMIFTMEINIAVLARNWRPRTLILKLDYPKFNRFVIDKSSLKKDMSPSPYNIKHIF